MAVAVTPPVHAPARMLWGAAVILVLAGTFLHAAITTGQSNPFDFFGYFTNLTNLGTAVLFIVAGTVALRGQTPAWLGAIRGVSVSCMIIVGVIYTVFVPGTGSAPPWVSAVLHVAAPAVALIDWVCVGDRGRLPWRRLWWLLPYPMLWLVVVLARGATDGWVPYGFLLPEHGAVSLTLVCLGLLASLLTAGSLVWATSRFPGIAGARAPAGPSQSAPTA